MLRRLANARRCAHRSLSLKSERALAVSHDACESQKGSAAHAGGLRQGSCPRLAEASQDRQREPLRPPARLHVLSPGRSQSRHALRLPPQPAPRHRRATSARRELRCFPGRRRASGRWLHGPLLRLVPGGAPEYARLPHRGHGRPTTCRSAPLRRGRSSLLPPLLPQCCFKILHDALRCQLTNLPMARNRDHRRRTGPYLVVAALSDEHPYSAGPLGGFPDPADQDSPLHAAKASLACLVKTSHA
jgi:hypothetical protein